MYYNKILKHIIKKTTSGEKLDCFENKRLLAMFLRMKIRFVVAVKFLYSLYNIVQLILCQSTKLREKTRENETLGWLIGKPSSC